LLPRLPDLYVAANLLVARRHRLMRQQRMVLTRPYLRRNVSYIDVVRRVAMARRRCEDPKVAALRERRSLNPRPERVVDAEFGASEFFDTRDLVQVKYEMVRRVELEGAPVGHTASTFGFSRPTFYDAAAAVEAEGLAGLLSERPGPRRAHKLTDEVVSFAEAQLAGDAALRPRDLVAPIEARFGISVHPRSIERALTRARHPKSESPDVSVGGHAASSSGSGRPGSGGHRPPRASMPRAIMASGDLKP
jgi:transposase